MIKDLCNNIVMNSINSDGDKHHHEPLSSDSEDDTTVSFVVFLFITILI